jgi:hypothetical protein
VLVSSPNKCKREQDELKNHPATTFKISGGRKKKKKIRRRRRFDCRNTPATNSCCRVRVFV